ncbi:zinc finger protein SNAI2 [Contarinia nasturtii]|uniref:zinc finger protein SNAI2 n=1 Tax=Contarinia nasturtii TaxID=265458 RepID=UPI0012D47081|nr:zinc finger protein SNAI2 [Contarinia nasturtii]
MAEFAKSEVKNYNSCPLKKRPIMFLDPVVDSQPEQDEPVNLCVRKVNKEEPTSYVNKVRSMPLKDITTHNQQDRIRYAPYKIEEARVPYVKQELYNLLPGYAANTTNTLNYTQISPPPSASSIKSEPEYWQSFSREPSMSPPSNRVFVPSPPPMKIATVHQYAAVNKTHRYAPYVSRQHHIVEEYHSSMSPTHSHSSLGGSSTRSSMSPASSIEDPYTMMQANAVSTNKPTELPRYQCSDCNKSYSTYSGLTKHKQFHCTASPNNQAKKSFDCQFCPKTYTSLGALKMHIRTHTKPCKCHLCGKAFSRPWLLQGHIRTHTGDKPFSCQFCHRAFADKSNLRAHLQTHSDVKKYSCSTCSKTFSRMSLLTKHMESGCPGLHEQHH